MASSRGLIEEEPTVLPTTGVTAPTAGGGASSGPVGGGNTGPTPAQNSQAPAAPLGPGLDS